MMIILPVQSLQLIFKTVDISKMQARTLSIHGEVFTYYSDSKQKYFLWEKGFLHYLIIAKKKMDDELYDGYIKEVINN